MPDDLYHRDVLLWSEQQAELLRRVARGEVLGDVDWENVIEEIETVGRNELHEVRSRLRRLHLNLLRRRGWPESPSVGAWRQEAVGCQSEAIWRFVPSMRQHLDIAELHAAALKQLDRSEYDGMPHRAFPLSCPFTLDQLLNADLEILEDLLMSRMES